MAVELHKGILLAHHLGRRMDAGRLRPEQVSFGKLNNTREAIKICRTARTILGGNGISLEYPVIRHMVNLESVLTYEGTPEMHQLVLGQAFTGSDAFGASATVRTGSSKVEPGAVPATDVTLSWATFSDAADQAGISRRYGGIHFVQGDLQGRRSGRLIGTQVWAKALTYFNGTATP